MSFTDDCELHIQQLSTCFKNASQNVNTQIRRGVISPKVRVSVTPKSADVDLDVILDDDCKRRIDDALLKHLQNNVETKLPYSGFIVKPRDISLFRHVRVVQGTTLVGTTLKTWAYALLPPCL